nr:unnamed protein product [Spirometra erinaceieuropaei]
MQRDYDPSPTWQRVSSGHNFLNPSDASETAQTAALSPYRNVRGSLRHQSRSLNHELPRSANSPHDDSYQPTYAHTSYNHSPSNRPLRQLPVAVTVCEIENPPQEVTPTLSLLDEFDYFCSMSGASSSKFLSECSTPVTNLDINETKARRQRLKKLRCQSVLPPTKANEGANVSPTGGEGRNLQQEGRRIPPYNYQRAYTQDCSLHPNDFFAGEIPPIRRQRSTEKEPLALRHSSSTSLARSIMTPNSPNRRSLTPQVLPPLPLCTESPLGAAISQEALAADDPDLVEFKVQVVGSPGVGKTTICQCLTNLNKEDSDFDAGDDTDEDVQNFSIRAMLKGNEFNNIEIQDYVDAFLVVYAIDDATTYEFARRVLLELCKSMAENVIPPAGFILAANKFDLVRRREVNSEDARQFANAHNAKFLEISAALGHMIPELLLTVITHLCELDESKLGPRRAFNHPLHYSTATSSPSSPRTGVSARREQAVYTSAANSSAGAAAAGSGVHASRGAGSKGGLTKFFRRHFTRSSTGCDSSD